MAAMEKQPAWLQEVATPAYVIDEKQLIHNLEILKEFRIELAAVFCWPRRLFPCMPVIP